MYANTKKFAAVEEKLAAWLFHKEIVIYKMKQVLLTSKC